MRGPAVLLLAICASGCVTRALWKPQESHRKPRPAGEADLAIERRAVPLAPPGAVVFAIEPAAKAGPKRLRKDLSAGRTWLRLRDPFALSFAGTDLLERRTPFLPERIAVDFAQTRLSEGGVKRDPALLRLEGRVPRDAFASRVEPLPQPSGEPRGLDHVADRDLRVLLGHAMDTLLPLAEDAMPSDVCSWFGVEGPAEDWRAALGLAQARGSLAPLLPYRVIVRRWRAMENGGPCCFRVPLADVVVAAQMAVAPEPGGFRWTWEGLWMGAFESPGEGAPAHDLPSLLRYREYKQDEKYGTAGVLWRSLLTPLALGADYGIYSLDDWLDRDDDRFPGQPR